MKIFVYGSLMSGMEAEEYMRDAELLCRQCITADDFSMFIHDGYPFVFSGRSKYPIKGELYEISPQEMKNLREYEGDFYYLEVTDVICGDNAVSAYLFMGRGHFFGMTEVVGGDYRKYCGDKR